MAEKKVERVSKVENIFIHLLANGGTYLPFKLDSNQYCRQRAFAVCVVKDRPVAQ